MTWTLVIHGGAGKLDSEMVSPEQDAGARAGLSRALDAGSKVLADGGGALDAVEAAVRVLEDDPHFNSGRGAVFTHDGTLELDAAIMDGRTRAAGAVAAATATRNPVGLARAILDDGRHVFLAGKGADAFSLERDLPQADADWFATDERRRQFAEFQADGGGFDVDMKYGTVGAVACDTHGHVAAATSTGGVTGKRWGRIGDTPVIGAGTFADDRACAVSCTGSGEFFLRVGVGHEIAARVRLSGESLQVAADAVLAEVKALGGTGGVIVAGPDGDMAWSFNTVGMYRGRASSEGSRTVAIYANEPT
ncbi:isoaspartyl peptidase/L-asparaginase [Sphingomonas sp. PP-CE-1G-424]|uniref:isoaspartyl peptidase/L-asparaginase family protein n=1 Tax=Sphingomonas sp. PP-CE-1G-424 TaxID=2135658 RepID=UPI001054EA12|nr:isoaspartyl peptidase/L-asparaginase [Sphingomonas sp. PP-CE-1G-424]TCP73300.1 beta-aspartyl-peptidase (threonine type) [Sphingomonas sp. PP-CE-1G-424]